MDAMEAILTRRSTRRFADEPIPKEALEALLRAAHGQPHRRERTGLGLSGHYRQGNAEQNGRRERSCRRPLRKAAAGILICGDLHRAFVKAPDFWVIDGAIAAENTLIAAPGPGSGGRLAGDLAPCGCSSGAENAL